MFRVLSGVAELKKCGCRDFLLKRGKRQEIFENKYYCILMQQKSPTIVLHNLYKKCLNLKRDIYKSLLKNNKGD